MPPNGVAEISLTANPGALATGLNAAYRMVANFAKLSGSVLQGLNLAPKVPKSGNNLSVARVALATAVGTYTRRGIDMLVDQGKAVFSFNDRLVRFGIAAKKSGIALQFVGHSARQIAAEAGLDPDQVLATGRAYVDLAGAANFTADKMRILAHAGQVSEATGSDIAGMMYQLTTSMKVADSQMEDTMGGLINQAKEGAIEAQQMAREFGALMPLYAKFGVVGREGAIQAGAMFQVIRDGYNTADEAGTGIVRIFGGIRANASRFEKAGIKIWNIDKNGVHTARKFSDIFRDINNSKLAKDPELLKKAFGRSEAWRGWEILSANVERLHEMEEAGKRNGVIQQDMAKYTESAQGRINIAMTKLKNAVADAFTPERIDNFVTAVEGLSEKIEPLVKMIGLIGDGLNAIYSSGKQIRKQFNAGPTGISEEEMVAAQRFAWKNKIHPNDVVRGLQMGSYTRESIGMTADEIATENFKKQIDNLMPNDRTTKQSNQLAADTLFQAANGTALRAAVESYINEAGLTTKQVADMHKASETQNAIEDKFDKDQVAKLWVPTPRFSTEVDKKAQKQIERQFNQNTAAATALQRAFSGMSVNIHMDGNKVGGSVRESTDARRR